MPIKNVPANKLAERAEHFEEAAGYVTRAPSFSKLSLVIRPSAFDVSAHAYFFLNEAYKASRIQAGSRTMLHKIGALTAIAVGVTKPLRPPSLDVEEEEYLYVNGALAMRLCCTVMKCSFDQKPFDSCRRWYRSVQDLHFPCLDPMLAEANASGDAIAKIYDPLISADELAKIDLLVDALESMAS